MKLRLIVMRHAKSAWDTDAAGDHERPLKKRGRKATPRVAARLAELGWLPEVVLSSDSLRTRQTSLLLLETWNQDVPLVFVPELYLGSTEEMLAALANLPHDVTCAMLVGHNPGCEEAIEDLCGESVRVTTASAILLEADLPSWQAAEDARGHWHLVDVLRPKEFS